MLTAKLAGSYRKAITGTKVFRYVVSGTDAEVQAYSDAQGDNLRLDEQTGKPIWFSTRYIADNVSLIITTDNNVVADDTELSKLESLVKQFGVDVAKLVVMQRQTASAE
jgi:adenine specific DNA methylase Mod